jgi:hypothetical protein
LRASVNILFVAAVLALIGCSKGSLGSGTRASSRETSETFATSKAVIERAIESALGDRQFYGLYLREASQAPDIVGLNKFKRGFVMYSSSPLGSIRIGDEQFPYIGYYHIDLQDQAEGTKVVVHTVYAEIISGTGFGWHGRANRYKKVAPVKKFEEDLLRRISGAIQKSQRS